MLRVFSRRSLLNHYLFLLTLILGVFSMVILSTKEPSVFANQDLNTNIILAQKVRPEVSLAAFVAPMPQTTQMDLTLALNLADSTKLDEFIVSLHDEKSPNYHNWITPSEFGERFGRSKNEYQAMVDWLKAEGFTIKRTWPNRLAIDFSASVEQIEKTFQVGLNQYQYQDKKYFANSRSPQIPSKFSQSVLTILGLENFSEPLPVHQTQSQQLNKQTGDKSGVQATNNGRAAIAPKDFAVVYNTAPLIAQGIDGTGQDIAIAARCDFNISDVQKFRSNFGLADNDPKKVFPLGPVSNLGGVEETEVLLDVQLSGAAAPKANIQAIITPKISQSLQSIYNDFPNIPIVSLSFGLCEKKLMLDSSKFFDSLYAQGVTQGQTTFVASGDNGANDCQDGSLAVNGLASSPNVVAVGGTTLDPIFNSSGDATGYGSETVWNNGRGSGGGFSTVFAKPAYQIGAGVPKDDKRAVPDVALLANPIGPGFFIVQGGITTVIGGTSASAPAWAGIMTLVEQFNKGVRLGNANFRIYALGSNQAVNGTKVYNDITVGNNSVSGVSGFNAQNNYDLVTGWGSVNANEFAKNFFSQKNNFEPVRNLQATAQINKVTLNWQAPNSSIPATPVLDLANLANLDNGDQQNSLVDLETGQITPYHFGAVRSSKPTRSKLPSPQATNQPPSISNLSVVLKGKNKAIANFSISDADGNLGAKSGVSILLFDKNLKGVVTPRNGSLLLFGDKSVFAKPLDFTGQQSATFPFTLKGLRNFPSASIWASSIRDDAGSLSLAPKVTGISGRAGSGATPMIMNGNGAIFDKDDTVGINLDAIDDDADTMGMTVAYLDGDGKVVFALGVLGDNGLQNFSPFPLTLVNNPVAGKSKFNVNFSVSGISSQVKAGTIKSVAVSLVDSNGNQSAIKLISLDGATQTNNLLRYNVYRSQASPVLLNPINLVATMAATTTTFTDTINVTGKTTFNYIVTAVYENGESPASNEVVISVNKP